MCSFQNMEDLPGESLPKTSGNPFLSIYNNYLDLWMRKLSSK